MVDIKQESELDIKQELSCFEDSSKECHTDTRQTDSDSNILRNYLMKYNSAYGRNNGNNSNNGSILNKITNDESSSVTNDISCSANKTNDFPKILLYKFTSLTWQCFTIARFEI
ncbi:uncharacterized protein LOC142325366 isoform X5 [Lycorma delicatula]|uniref:uncharacterized protein LOC142325366 isoform X5 n=1 Tax=Lycorma delicatula TaxID=130591 RepID=UPI003F516480